MTSGRNKLSTPVYNNFHYDGSFRYLQQWIPPFLTFLSEAAKVKLPVTHIIYGTLFVRPSTADLVADAMVDNKNNGKTVGSFR